MQLQTHFSDRESLARYIREHFTTVAARGAEISPTQGGRSAAELLISQIRPDRYAATRNMLAGSVTRLSPYLRHGVVTLPEVRRHILTQTPPQKSYKFLQELAWRDYYQRVYAHLGNDIWRDIESPKTGIRRYQQELPADIANGTTGAVCMDSFAHDLRATGYLHNHARMWTAAYVVHHRRVRWQAGAHWFLQHLLDGDPASNNLSWQWVASTFAAKPYYFNRENLARYTDNVYCNVCPLAHGSCPFAGSYEDVAERIFPADAANVTMSTPTQTPLMQKLANGEDDTDQFYMGNRANVGTDVSRPPVPLHSTESPSTDGRDTSVPTQNTLIWVNEESLNPYNPALQAYPEATPIFIFDDAAIEAAGWTLKRIMFVYECLLEIPNITIYRGSPIDILKSLLVEQRAQSITNTIIATTPAVEPRLQQYMLTLEKLTQLEIHPIAPLVQKEHIRDLRRFSRYWHDVEREVIQS